MRTLDRLVDIGCAAAAINLHHLPAAIPAALGSRYRGMPLVYSHESTLLGTGGALIPLRGFFADSASLLVVNGDSLCEWPLRELLARHRRTRAAATLLLAGRPDPRAFGGGVGVDGGGRVTALRGARAYGRVQRRFVFAGAAALRRELLDRLPAGPSDSITDLYEPCLAAGERLACLVTWLPWHDLGTPARYLEAVLGLAGRGGGGAPTAAGPASARVAPTATVTGSVLENGVRVGEGASIAGSLLLPRAQAGARCRLRGVIVGPAVAVPAGSDWSEVLLTRRLPNEEVPPGSARAGALLATPLAPHG